MPSFGAKIQIKLRHGRILASALFWKLNVYDYRENKSPVPGVIWGTNLVAAMRYCVKIVAGPTMEHAWLKKHKPLTWHDEYGCGCWDLGLAIWHWPITGCHEICGQPTTL